jgi:hypothetical protein
MFGYCPFGFVVLTRGISFNQATLGACDGVRKTRVESSTSLYRSRFARGVGGNTYTGLPAVVSIVGAAGASETAGV